MGGGIEHLTVLIRIKLTAGLDPKFLTVLDLYLYQNCKWFAIKCQYVTQHAATVDPQHSLTNRTSLASKPFGKKSVLLTKRQQVAHIVLHRQFVSHGIKNN